MRTFAPMGLLERLSRMLHGPPRVPVEPPAPRARPATVEERRRAVDEALASVPGPYTAKTPGREELLKFLADISLPIGIRHIVGGGSAIERARYRVWEDEIFLVERMVERWADQVDAEAAFALLLGVAAERTGDAEDDFWLPFLLHEIAGRVPDAEARIAASAAAHTPIGAEVLLWIRDPYGD